MLPAATVSVLLMWASSFLVIRVVRNDFAPGSLALGRLTVGSVALLVLALRARRPLPHGRTLGLVVTYGVLWFAAYAVALNAAERHLDAGTAALLVNFAPIIVAGYAGLFMDEGFPRPLVSGIVIAFSGVGLIALGTGGEHNDSVGVALGLLSALAYGSSVLMQKTVLRSIDAITATWVGCVAGNVSLLVFLPQTVRDASHAPTAAIAGVAYLGIFPTAVAFTLWAYVLTRTEAGRLTSTTLTVPAIAVLASWVFLGETPTNLGLLGGALCLSGVAISRRRPRSHPAPSADAAPQPAPSGQF
jgi:drug/metabolite transporter (DMT)-like permease